MTSIKRVLRIFRAISTNLVARTAPSLYVQLTKDTGRGDHGREAPEDIAHYFIECFNAYFAKLGIQPHEINSFLRAKTVMEYGPGDVLGVAILMIANGAEKAFCVDRFPLLNMSPVNVRVVEIILDSLDSGQRARANSCFNLFGLPTSGFDEKRIQYIVRRDGCSGLSHCVDLVYSRAVLEHVDDLDAVFADMYKSLRTNGLAAHLVDLRSHDFHEVSRLDFLVWPAWLWRLMYSHKGVPNRWRVDRYRQLLEKYGFDVILFMATEQATVWEVESVVGRLAPPFRSVGADELSWMGFWLICRRPDIAPARQVGSQ